MWSHSEAREDDAPGGAEDEIARRQGDLFHGDVGCLTLGRGQSSGHSKCNFKLSMKKSSERFSGSAKKMKNAAANWRPVNEHSASTVCGNLRMKKLRRCVCARYISSLGNGGALWSRGATTP